MKTHGKYHYWGDKPLKSEKRIGEKGERKLSRKGGGNISTQTYKKWGKMGRDREKRKE